MTKSRTIGWILLIAAVGAVGYFGWQRFYGPNPGAKTESAQKSSSSPRAAPVRVTIAPVEKADFPVYLTGLGTVQGFNTVVVRTRVDGQIDKIAFKEEQLINKGDLLAQIHHPPLQAAFDQGQAKKAQDEANLSNVNLYLLRLTRRGQYATTLLPYTTRSTP